MKKKKRKQTNEKLKKATDSPLQDSKFNSLGVGKVQPAYCLSP